MPDETAARCWALEAKWRTGRKVGRTIYAMVGSKPSNADQLIGVLDYPVVAKAIVKQHNKWAGMTQDQPQETAATCPSGCDHTQGRLGLCEPHAFGRSVRGGECGCPAIGLPRIVYLLAETYDDEGIAIWLGSWNKYLDGRPIDLCRSKSGRERVLQYAESLTGMEAT